MKRRERTGAPATRWAVAAGVALIVVGAVLFAVRRDGDGRAPHHSPTAGGRPVAGTPPGPGDGPRTPLADLRDRVRQALEAEEVGSAEADSALAAWERTIRDAPEPARPDVLERAVAELQQRFADRPLVLAAVRHAVAEAYSGMGLHEQGIALEREALAERRRTLGEDDPATLASLGNLGGLLNATGRFDEALPVLRDAVERDRRVLGEDDPQTLGALNNTAAILWRTGQLDEARDLLTETLAGCRRAFGDDHPFTLSTANNLAVLLTQSGRSVDALPVCREVLAARRRVLGDDHVFTLQSIDSVVQVLRFLRRYDEALPLAREALDRSVRTLGEEDPRTLLRTTSLGTLLLDAGKPADALTVLAPAQTAARRALAEHDPRRLGTFLAALGRARTRTGDYEGALAALEDANLLFGNPEVATTSDVTYALSGLVELEEAWQAVDPDGGHERRAADARTQLERQNPNPIPPASTKP